MSDAAQRSAGIRTALFLALAALFVLRNDFWLWNDASLLFGLPVGLTYHALFCLVTAGLMALLVRFAWPSQLGEAADDGASEP